MTRVSILSTASILSLLVFLALQLTAPAARSSSASCGIEGVAADPPTFGSCHDCHVQLPINSGDGSLTFEGLPTSWSPSMTYRIRALLEDPGQRLWGIRLTLIDEAGSPIGAILPADANGDLCQQDGRTYLRQSGAGRRPGVLDGPVDWLFDWTSPAAGNGTATLYAVGFAGNLDGSEQGDFTYTTASTIVEEAATGPEVTLVLQPDTPIVQAGTTLTIHAHVRNHTDRPQTVFVGSRAILPSGRARPQTGSILPLVRLDLAPFEQQDTTLVHPIPASAPAVTVEYRGFVGVPPASLLDRDGFMLAVLPPGS